MTTVIKIENLGKRYLIGHEKQARYSTLGDSMSNGIRAMGRRIRHPLQANPEETEFEEFWALKDINFEIQQGDKVGIIGRNGAGKSTLLKILSRVTSPSTGKVTLKGRVASLLEVGTGFHPELSGRENIYLNGAILGMKKAEIKRKFDEIVDFAEVEKFLDTPVKRYSSGMYVRLAFAVAAHLEPEILIVDEVLAVGDAQFRKKCLGKMEEVSQEGRTILFVSHNLTSISGLCNMGILMADGQITHLSTVDQVISKYLGQSHSLIFHQYSLAEKNKKSKKAYIEKVSIQNDGNQLCNTFNIGESVNIMINIKLGEVMRTKDNIKAAIELKSTEGLKIANMINTDSNYKIDSNNDHIALKIRITDIRLYPDDYLISAWIGSEDSFVTYDKATDCVKLSIIGGGSLTIRNLPRSDGLLFLTPEWSEVSNSYE